MARRYDSKEAKRRILTACVRLFLEKGYTNTKVAEILKEADVSAGSFQNIFRTKDGVLTELIGGLAFAFVAPLGADNDRICHICRSDHIFRIVLRHPQHSSIPCREVYSPPDLSHAGTGE